MARADRTDSASGAESNTGVSGLVGGGMVRVVVYRRFGENKTHFIITAEYFTIKIEIITRVHRVVGTRRVYVTVRVRFTHVVARVVVLFLRQHVCSRTHTLSSAGCFSIFFSFHLLSCGRRSVIHAPPYSVYTMT